MRRKQQQKRNETAKTALWGGFFSSSLKKANTAKGSIMIATNITPECKILPLDRLPCPIMPKGHPNGFCDCPHSRIVFLGTCHSNGKCIVLTTVPGADREVVTYEDLHAC